METSTVEPRSIARAAHIYAQDVATYRKVGYARKTARKIAFDQMLVGFIADAMIFEHCSQDVAESRAADLAATVLTFERKPADDNTNDPTLTWLRVQMDEAAL